MLSPDVVTELNFFAVKSCAATTIDGLPPQTLDVSPTGLAWGDVRDREYVIAEAPGVGDDEGLFVSQRGWNGSQKPAHSEDRKLAVVRTDVRLGRLALSADDVGELELPTDYNEAADAFDVKIHGSNLPARDQGHVAAEFYTEVLGRPVRLVRACRELTRALPNEYSHPSASNRVGGADGYPILLTSHASLGWLVDNQRRWPDREPVRPDDALLSRYRGNVQIDGRGLGAFSEDRSRVIQIGRMVAFMAKASARCPVPNIVQESGVVDKVSSLLLLTRVGYRMLPNGEVEKGAFMGQNINHVWEEGLQLHVGDDVNVLSWASGPNISINRRVAKE